MWHLSRVHMESIGHPDARFDPLATDFTDAAGRPASSVLWLENMGGKTSWLSLVFSTLCPALKDFLGKPDKQLGDYILGSDTAHVIIEFSRVAGARTLFGGDIRLLLGQVLQWQDHRQDKARESAALQRRLWGVVVPPTGSPLTFEDATNLIRVDGTRRRPLPEYIDDLTSALQGRDAFRPSSHQSDWADWLRGHGLDPEVFADQLKMSADEGSISERFQFKNGDELVQWALPYIIPPEIPNRVSGIVEQVRDTLSKRPGLLRQQHFCSGVHAKLSHAAVQQTELDAQRDEATEAWGSALSLVDQMRAAQIAAKARSAGHEQEALRLRGDAERALTLRNKLQAMRREAEVVRARLRHAAASAEHTEALHKREGAQQDVDAWELTAQIKRLSEITLRLDQIQAVLDEADDAAAPLRDAVSAAERRLAAKLSHLRKTDKAALDQTESQIIREQQAMDEAESRSRAAAAERLHAERDATEARKDLEHLAAEMAEAVRDGLLRQDQPVDDAIFSKVYEVQRFATEADRQAGRADKADHDRIAADEAVDDARQTRATLRAQLERAQDRAEKIASAAAQLMDIPEIAAAFEMSHPDLWHDGPSAAGRLSQQAETASAERIAVELRSAANRRAVDELDRSGWLPASPDVEDVLDALDKAGIVAFSGWKVLREQFSEDRHHRIINQHPEMVDGVVLADADELEAAVHATDGLSLTAPTALTAGAGGLSEDGPETVIVAGPAALHDSAAAATEGRRRNEDLEASERASREAAARGEALRTARAQLVSFIESNPTETVAALQSEVLGLPSQITAAEAALDGAADSRRAAESEIKKARERLQSARNEHGDALRAETSLRRLKEHQGRRDSRERALAGAEERIRSIVSRTGAAEKARQEASVRLAAAKRSATDIHRRVDAIDAGLTRHKLTTTEHPPPDDPVDNLENALETAQLELLAAAPPGQATRERAALTKERAEISELLRKSAEPAVAEARRLLAGPGGATTQTRNAATGTARSRLHESHGEEAVAKGALGQAEAEMRQMEEVPQSRRAPLDESPESPEQAQQLIERLTAEISTAHTRHDTASKQQAHHTQMMEHTDRHSDAFRRECDTLSTALRRHASTMSRQVGSVGECRDSLPWPGNPSDAEQERRRHETLLDETAEYMRIATDERDRSLDEVRQLASEHRDLLAEDMPTLLPRLTEGDSDQRGVYAGELAGQLRTYALTIEKELDDLERHRRVVIDHLAGNVTQTIKLLARLQQRTTLPQGLDDWSNRPFLRLTHPKLPETPGELAGRVATVVDRICSDSAEGRTSGMDLLYAAVSASVGGAFTATILKPHKRLTDQRVDISEMASFSGGQKLTAALVIFAALTRMRTEAHSSSRHGNADLPLLLDNPIGKANHATLMEVQQRVGEAFGLQLIYTTGLDDMGALASFDNIIRLDGRQNPRSGQVHVVVDDDYADSVYLDSIQLQQNDDTAA